MTRMSKPGNTPAINNSPIEVPETTPYTIMPMLGGISSAISLALIIKAIANVSG